MDRTLIKNALLFRSSALFKKLDDSQIFAVTMPDGSIGYCCCMGNGGEHYSLALYLGVGGFTTYLNSCSMDSSNTLEQFEKTCSYHSINCDFENTAESLCDKKTRDYIKEVAKEEGIKICRPKGWPEFFVMDGSSQYTGLRDKKTIDAMTLALQAGCEVARKIDSLDSSQIYDLGFENNYSPAEGGKIIPLLTLQSDGIWFWSKTATPPKIETEFMEPEFENAEAVSKIKAMRHRGIFQCRVIHCPMPVGGEESKYFPVELLAVLKSQGVAPFVAEFVEENEDWEFDILDTFADGIITSGICPSSIETDDDRTYAILSDFCEKTGILLHKTKRVDSLYELWAFLFSMMRY